MPKSVSRAGSQAETAYQRFQLHICGILGSDGKALLRGVYEADDGTSRKRLLKSPLYTAMKQLRKIPTV